MKICNNCGCSNEDESYFCKQCGSALQDNTSLDSMQGQSQDSSDNPVGNQNPFPLLQLLKTKGASAVFLAAVIGFTASVIFNLISGFTMNAGSFTYLLDSMGLDAEMSSYLTDMLPAMRAGTLIGTIPSIVSCIGLWFIVKTCRQTGSQPLDTNGIQFVKGVQIFEFVLSCIVLVIFWIISFAAAAILSADTGLTELEALYGDSAASDVSALTGAAIVLIFAVMAIATILVILYNVKLIGSLNRALEIIDTGTCKKNVSLYVAVIGMISGVISLIYALLLFSIFSIIEALTTILFSVVMLSFRKEAKSHIVNK